MHAASGVLSIAKLLLPADMVQLEMQASLLVDIPQGLLCSPGPVSQAAQGKLVAFLTPDLSCACICSYTLTNCPTVMLMVVIKGIMVGIYCFISQKQV